MKLWWLSAVLWALCLALGPTKASATLLFAGGEDIDFVCDGGSTCYSDQSAGAFRTGWARLDYQVQGIAGDPPPNRFSTPTFSANSTLWVHGQYCSDYCNASNQSTADSQMVRLMDSAGNPALIVRGTGTAGGLKISSRTSAGVFTDLVTCPSALNMRLMQFDLYVNYGSSGEVALYNNSAKVCDFTGDVTNGDASTTINRVELSSARVFEPYTQHYGGWSEVIVATTDTRAMARFSATTVADGNTVGFSGTNVCSAIWNARDANDANYGYSSTANVVHECTINGSLPAGAYNVVALVMGARALVGTTGPLHFDFVTRTGGTDYTSSDFAPLPSFSNIGPYIQTLNPATSGPWAVSDFSTAGFNLGEETKP